MYSAFYSPWVVFLPLYIFIQGYCLWYWKRYWRLIALMPSLFFIFIIYGAIKAFMVHSPFWSLLLILTPPFLLGYLLIFIIIKVIIKCVRNRDK